MEAEKGDEGSYQYLSINYYNCRLLVEDGRLVVVEAEKGYEGNYQTSLSTITIAGCW